MMGIQGQRQEIVSALAAVPGISATSTAPDVALDGAAWPVWRDATWIAFGQIVGTWYVYVALTAGSDQATVEDGDDTLETISQALWKVGQITLVEPFAWQMEGGGGTLPVLRFTLEV